MWNLHIKREQAGNIDAPIDRSLSGEMVARIKLNDSLLHAQTCRIDQLMALFASRMTRRIQ